MPFSRLVLGNHEKTAMTYFQPILDSGRYAMLPDALRKMNGVCRVRGNHSSVIHDHESCKRRWQDGSNDEEISTADVDIDRGYADFVCDGLEGWDIT
mmetsp:Transcript_7347/g.14438  ORF Transcript_7347/g.14438 Transcript_7347/m.14438 type:complete len:97 (-) Transcript_7347:272-562(-)